MQDILPGACSHRSKVGGSSGRAKHPVLSTVTWQVNQRIRIHRRACSDGPSVEIMLRTEYGGPGTASHSEQLSVSFSSAFCNFFAASWMDPGAAKLQVVPFIQIIIVFRAELLELFTQCWQSSWDSRANISVKQILLQLIWLQNQFLVAEKPDPRNYYWNYKHWYFIIAGAWPYCNQIYSLKTSPLLCVLLRNNCQNQQNDADVNPVFRQKPGVLNELFSIHIHTSL